ncbi:hypothetical protein CAEBREN_24115 [Caenorhabditis brenneri]|uniref:CC domain-containing protein n=1 Tax=Caenorhabditis brenneri TaxID=135651 RepID=G0PK27_CAEBE|nr:hypothetical protein CAEBREN_24115 [Caenorhabditis brenneri]
MFKVIAISALFLVFTIEAANLACKFNSNTVAVDGACPDGTTLIGKTCCAKDDVFDVDAHTCSSEPMPAIDGYCPFGFLLVANGCCPNSDAKATEKK